MMKTNFAGIAFPDSTATAAVRGNLFKAVLMLVALLVLPGLAWSQDAQQNLTLIVSGQPGQIPIVQMNGKSYVDIDALARLTNSSVSIKGNEVILTPPGSAPSTLAADHEPSAPTAQLKLVAERQPVDPEPSEPAGQTKLVATGEKPATPESGESKTAALGKTASAQDTPIGPAGTSVATQATPEAAVNADELRKAAQNPIASLISVPIQPTWNFGIGPSDRVQNIWLVSCPK